MHAQPVPGAGGDHIPIDANGARRAELGKDEHAPKQHALTHRRNSEENVRNQSAHQRTRCHRVVPRTQRKRAMSHNNNECSMKTKTSMTQDAGGRR